MELGSAEQVLANVRELMASNDLQGAADLLKQAGKRWPRETEFVVRHANLLSRLGNHKGAFKAYSKAMKRSPERLDACQGAAQCALMLGKARKAEQLFGRAIGLGMNIDEATSGIARSLALRGKHHEAWERALSQFNTSDRKSRSLHTLLQEMSPIIGATVPSLNEFDLADAEINVEVTHRASQPKEQFSAGSLEAMAGIDSEDLSKNIDLSADDLLGYQDADTSSGSTSLGIDLSALLESDPVDDVAEESQPQTAVEAKPEQKDSDDPFDDWPDI